MLSKEELQTLNMSYDLYHAIVSTRANEIWVTTGCKDDRTQENWLEAERIVDGYLLVILNMIRKAKSITTISSSLGIPPSPLENTNLLAKLAYDPGCAYEQLRHLEDDPAYDFCT